MYVYRRSSIAIRMLGRLGAWCLFEVLQTRLKAHVVGGSDNG